MLVFQNKIVRAFGINLLLTLMTIPAALAARGDYDGVVVFGASFSDSGNGFVLMSNPERFGVDESCELGASANVPPYDSVDELFIPETPYSIGGHNYTNGATWVETLVKGTGLSGSVKPALRNVGTQAKN